MFFKLKNTCFNGFQNNFSKADILFVTMYHFTDQNQHTTYTMENKVANTVQHCNRSALCTPTSTANRFVMISSTAPIPAGVGITAAVMTDSDVMEGNPATRFHCFQTGSEMEHSTRSTTLPYFSAPWKSAMARPSVILMWISP